jgi:hypothetical protein
MCGTSRRIAAILDVVAPDDKRYGRKCHSFDVSAKWLVSYSISHEIEKEPAKWQTQIIFLQSCFQLSA